MAARAAQEIVAAVIRAISFALQQPLIDRARRLSEANALAALDTLLPELAVGP